MSNPSSDAVRIRPLSGGDRAALAELPKRISAESAISRFHGGVTMLTDRTLDRLLNIEVGRHEALIAVDDRGIAGVARYARDETDPTTAEVAILVADEWQHHGVARPPGAIATAHLCREPISDPQDSPPALLTAPSLLGLGARLGHRPRVRSRAV